ncbi:MAG: FliO/MopB family protein [Lachnospiraceae bacterium]
MTGDFLSLTGAVLTVICVLILAYWGSRLLGRNWIKASSGRNLKIIEQLSVGNDRQLVMISVHDHYYLLGVSAAGIQMLTELDGDFDQAAIPGAEGSPPDGWQKGAVIGDLKFLEILKAQMDRHQKKKREDK